MERKTFKLNEVIFACGAYQKWMYNICEGSVDIYSDYGTADQKKLVTLKKGQFFGEIGMIALVPRTATAIAAEDHVVLEQISDDDFEDYLKNHPENLQPIMSSVSARIRELTEDMSGITQMTNALLGEEENGNTAADFIKRLLGSLKVRKGFRNEFAVQNKRQQALSGEIPPVISFSAGDVIFRAGEQADCMYDICGGSVGIYSDYQTENQKLLTKLYENEVFGEMGILDDMPRSATAVCLTDCSVLVIKPENFMQFFRNKPVKILQILMQMCMRLRDLTNNYLQVCKILEDLLLMEEDDGQVDEELARMEHNLQMQISTSMYDTSVYKDCWRNLF